MANITINNTDKSGWLHININDYYNGLNGDHEHYAPIGDGMPICVGKLDGVEYVELHVEYEKEPFYLTNGAGNGVIRTVDTVNGVAPTSIADLTTKLLALFP